MYCLLGIVTALINIYLIKKYIEHEGIKKILESYPKNCLNCKNREPFSSYNFDRCNILCKDGERHCYKDICKNFKYKDELKEQAKFRYKMNEFIHKRRG